MGSAVFKNASPEPPPLRFKRGLLVGALVFALVVFITLLALSYAYPAARSLRDAPPPAEWSSKMERLGVCLVYYAVRHDAKLPARLSELYKDGYAKELSLFDSADTPGKVASAEDIDAGADFIYLPQGAPPLTELPQPVLKRNVPGGRTLLASKKGLSWDAPPEAPSVAR